MQSRVLARVVTEAFAPAVLVAGMTVVIGWRSTGWHWAGLAWGLAASLFTSVVPFGYVLRAVRAGRLRDHHIGDRLQRRGPLLFGLASIVLGMTVLALLGAPWELVALGIAIFAGGVSSMLVNLHWKMSIHSAVASATVIGLAIEFGVWLLLTAPVAAMVGWSRVRLADHTGLQVVVGAIVGGLVSGLTFALAR